MSITLVFLLSLSLSHIMINVLSVLLNSKGSRRYGVIECDPLVRRGLEKTVSMDDVLVMVDMPDC